MIRVQKKKEFKKCLDSDPSRYYVQDVAVWLNTGVNPGNEFTAASLS